MPADAPLEDLAPLAAYAGHVTARLARPGRLPVESPLGREPGPAAWFEARAAASFRALATAQRLEEPPEFPTPWTVNAAQMQCQKPFQLWNVTREEWKQPIAFERGLRFVLGQAAHEHGPTREGRPGSVEGATSLAREADRERARAHADAWSHRRGLLALLAGDPARSGLCRRDPGSRP